MIAAAVLFAAISPAAAVCSPPKSFATFDGGTYNYFYMGTTNPADVTGGFYEPGSGKAMNNNGTYDVSQWLFNYAGYPGLYASGNWGSAGVAGCASGAMTIELWATTSSTDGRGSFVRVTTDDDPMRQNRFDFTNCGAMTGVVPPVYKVTSSGRAGSTVNTSGNIPSATAGDISCETASAPALNINVYTISSATEPSSDPAAGWTLAGNVPAGGGAFSVDADCSDTNVDVWVATGISDGGDPVFLGPATQVECDPNLADPRIKPIDRPGNFDRIRARSR
ncbi:hypothetical protein ABI59_03775 [Acidobacteria bacterium Mor1]|nr:hypothetical protein ABI59_03775 [Acidobacteria bacterium Mor1]